MAPRLNIEDQFWLEVIDLAIKVGDKDRAIGNAIRFFRFAQEEHRKGKLVSVDDFHAQAFLPELIPVFATQTEEGIKAKGSEKHFTWLEKKAEAGRKGGRSTSEAKTKHLKQNRPKQTEAEPKQIEASSSISISPSSSSSNSNSKNTTTTAPVKSAEIHEAFRIWCDTLSKFKIPPSKMNLPQENSLARAIVQLGFENVCLALEGQRYEKPTESFDPRRHLSIDRALHRDAKGKSRWEEFSNMAKAERLKNGTTRTETAQGSKIDPHLVQGPEPTPEEVAAAKEAFMKSAAIGKSMKKQGEGGPA